MTAKRFRVNELVKYNYSEIGEYIDENHTDRPLRNDILAELLNELHEENKQLRNDCSILVQSNQDYRKENEQLKEQLRDCEKFRHTVFQEISKEMSKHD